MFKRAALAVVFLAGAAWADPVESVRETADQAFQALLPSGARPLPKAPAAPVAAPAKPAVQDDALDPKAGADVLKALKERAVVVAPEKRGPSTKRGPTIYLRLAPVKNGYWRSATQFPLGGRPAWLSFMFNRSQQFFGSVLGQSDAAAQLLDVSRLIQEKLRFSVNGADYEAWLSPDIFDKLNSRIVLRGSSGDRHASTIRDLIASTLSTGFTAGLGSQTYKVFFVDDIKLDGGWGRLDASRQNLIFAMQDGSDFHLYLFAYESIPSTDMAVYRLWQDKRVGLQLLENGAVLGITPDP